MKPGIRNVHGVRIRRLGRPEHRVLRVLPHRMVRYETGKVSAKQLLRAIGGRHAL